QQQDQGEMFHEVSDLGRRTARLPSDRYVRRRRWMHGPALRAERRRLARLLALRARWGEPGRQAGIAYGAVRASRRIAASPPTAPPSRISPGREASRSEM